MQTNPITAREAAHLLASPLRKLNVRIIFQPSSFALLLQNMPIYRCDALMSGRSVLFCMISNSQSEPWL